MHPRLTVVAGVVAAILCTSSVAAQDAVPIDHWHGTVTGIVEQVSLDSQGRQVVLLDNRKTYRVRTEAPPALTRGDGVMLNRDFVVLVEPSTVVSSELAAARSRCRAEWPADFVMQRYCIEQQEEAYRAVGGRD